MNESPKEKRPAAIEKIQGDIDFAISEVRSLLESRHLTGTDLERVTADICDAMVRGATQARGSYIAIDRDPGVAQVRDSKDGDVQEEYRRMLETILYDNYRAYVLKTLPTDVSKEETKKLIEVMRRVASIE